MKLYLLLPLGSFLATAAFAQDVTINELRIDQPSSDNDEYFELTGAPGASLDGLTYLVIGDATGAGAGGGVEEAIDLADQVINANGFFVAAESTFTIGTPDFVTSLNFENSDNVTHLLVTNFTGSVGDDLDIDDNGVIDAIAPLGEVVDCVALVEDLLDGEIVYCTTQVGPDGSFVPGHIRLCVDGWQIGDFGNFEDTPGAENVCGVGTVFCSSLPNSTGEIGLLAGVGTPIATDNDLTVIASELPVDEMGYLVNGINPGSTPVGDGILCLGAGKGRHIAQIASSGAEGMIATTLDLTALPRSSSPPAAVMAGETWYFQLWHRDGTSTNFTEAISVTFQ